MTRASDDQQRNRDEQGRYRGGPVCDGCGRPAGHEYGSCGHHPNPGEGLVLCRRKRCSGCGACREAPNVPTAAGHGAGF